MNNQRIFRILLVLFLVVVLSVLVQMFRPQRTRVERVDPSYATVPAPGAGAIPDDVLAPPAQALALFGGLLTGHDDGLWYLPYAIVNEKQGVAMVNALREAILAGRGFAKELKVAVGAGAAGTDTLYPIQDGVERRFIASVDLPGTREVAESHIPLIITQPEPHHDAADVLYMDGHVQSVPIGQFPLTEPLLNALAALDPPEHAEAHQH